MVKLPSSEVALHAGWILNYRSLNCAQFTNFLDFANNTWQCIQPTADRGDCLILQFKIDQLKYHCRKPNYLIIIGQHCGNRSISKWNSQHGNHIFHSVALCYTQNAPMCCLPERKSCHVWCVWYRLTFVEIVRYFINPLTP